MNFKYTIKLTEESTPIIIKLEFEKGYMAQNELRNMGVNGIMVDFDNFKMNKISKNYYPPHRIFEITMEEI